jgi:hypothetical protein
LGAASRKEVTVEKTINLLSKNYRALKPNGLFIFDVFTEKLINNKEEAKDWQIFGWG